MKAVALGAGDKAAEVRDATAKLMAGLLEVRCSALLCLLLCLDCPALGSSQSITFFTLPPRSMHLLS
jgi:hypothetical protein